MAKIKATNKKGRSQEKNKEQRKARKIQVLYALKSNSPEGYSEDEEYVLVSAKNRQVEGDPTLINKSLDIDLFNLHIHDAPERRKILGLREDRKYEIMVSFSATILHNEKEKEEGIQEVTYSKFYTVPKGDDIGGFSNKSMFRNLRFKNELKFDVSLIEIDNEKVDPEPLSKILSETGIGSVMDLAPINTKQYLELASKIVKNIQNAFSADQEGDDLLWAGDFSLTAKTKAIAKDKLTQGIYALVETQNITTQNLILVGDKIFHKTGSNKKEIAANYLVFIVSESPDY